MPAKGFLAPSALFWVCVYTDTSHWEHIHTHTYTLNVSVLCAYTGNINSHVCAHILWTYVVIQAGTICHQPSAAPSLQIPTPKRNEDMSGRHEPPNTTQTHTHTPHTNKPNKNPHPPKRQIFPNTHQAPKTNDHLRNKSPKLSDKAKTSQHPLLDRRSDHTQKCPSCRLGSKPWPSQEFLLCQGLHPLERSILSLSELHKGVPLG